MKKNGIKPVCWKRILAALFAAVLILQTVPSHLAVSASASETKTQTQSQTHATEKEKEEKDSSPAAAAEEKSAADKKNSETDKSSSKTEGSKSDSSKEDEKTDKKKSNSDKTNAKDSENKSADTKDSGDKKTDDKKSDDDKTDDNKSDDKKSDDTKSGDSKTDEKSKESGTENSGSSKTSLNKKDEEQSAEGKSGQSKEKEEQKQESGAGQSGKSSEENKSGAAGTESDSGDASKKDSTGNSGKTGEEAAGDTKDSDSSDDKKEGSENSGNGSASESADKEEGSKEDDGQKSDGKDASESEKTTENGGNAASTNKKAEEENSDGKKDDTEIGNTKAGTGKSGNNQEDSTKKEADSEKKDEGGIEKTPAKEESGQITGGAEEKTETDNASARKEGETQVPEVTISYKGYRTGSSGDYSGSSKQSVLTNAEKLQFKFGFTGPDDTKLQYKLVDSTENVSEKNWKTVDSGDISGSDGVITVSGGDDGFDAAKKLYVRAYSESAEEGKREAKAKFGDDEKSHLSVDIDRKAPVVSITKPTEDILTKDSAEYELSVTERNAINVYSRTADQGSLSSDPSYPGEEGDWKKNKENVTSDSDKDKCEITFSDEGKKDVWFVVRDAAGNVSEVKKAKAYLIDKTAPSVTSLDAADVVSGKTVKVTAKFEDTVSNGTSSGLKSYSYKLLKEGESDPVKTGGEDLGTEDEAEITLGEASYNDKYTLKVTVTDKAGNISEEKTIELEFDSVKPEASLSGLSEEDSRKDSSGLFHYQTADLTQGSVTFSKSGGKGSLKKGIVTFIKESDKLNKVYEFKDNPKSVTKTLGDVIGTDTLGDGTWKIYAYVEDTSGNHKGVLGSGEGDAFASSGEGEILLATVVVDNTKPDLKLRAEAPVPAEGVNSVTRDEKTYYNGNVSVAADLAQENEPDFGEGLKWSVTTNAGTANESTADVQPEAESGKKSYTQVFSLAQGEKTLSIGKTIYSVTDLAGNTGTITFDGREKYYIDCKPPTVTYIATSDTPDVTIIGKDDSVTYTIEIDDGDTDSGDISCGIDTKSIQYSISSEASGTKHDAQGRLDQETGNYKFDVQVIGKGVITISVSDNLGNAADPVNANTLVCEGQAPEITEITITSSTGEKTVFDKNSINQAVSNNSRLEVAGSGNSFSFELDAKDLPVEPNHYSGLNAVSWTLAPINEETVGDAVGSGLVTIQNVVTNPTSVDQLLQSGTSGSIALPDTSNGNKLEGDYLLTLSVTDMCGNISALSNVRLNFDNTAPVIEVVMNKGELADYPTYYKSDNCGVTVRIDEIPSHLDAYEISIGSKSYKKGSLGGATESIEGNVLEIAIPASEVASLSDGEIIVTATAMDISKNSSSGFTIKNADSMNEKENDGEGNLISASFTLDKTAPVVKEIAILLKDEGDNAARKIDNKDDVRIKKGFDTTGDSSVDTYYFNDQKVIVEFDLEEENPDSSFFSGSDGRITQEHNTGENKKTSIIKDTMEDEGRYTPIFVKGQDKAGNKLTLDANASGEYACLAATDDNNGKITLKNAFIIDRTAPMADISYSSDATAYLYADSDGDGRPGSAAYANKPFTTTVTFSDQYGKDNNATDSLLDGNKVIVTQYRKTDTSNNYSTEENVRGWDVDEFKSSLSVSTSTDLEGHYYYTVQATDRAGNTLLSGDSEEATTITERFIGNLENKGGEDVPKKKLFKTGKNKQGFQMGYMLVFDQTSPIASFQYEFSGTNDVWLYKESLAGTGNDKPVISAYFNGDISPNIQISEVNLIDDRLQASEYIGENKEGTKAEKSFVQDAGIWKAQITDELSSDGTWVYYAVAGTDKAGNPVTMDVDTFADTSCARDPKGENLNGSAPSDEGSRLKTASGKYTSSFLFIIDKIAPQISLTYIPLEGKQAFVYTDRNEGDTTGTKTLYAFVKEAMTVKANITNDNEHIDPTRMFYADLDTGYDAEKNAKSWVEKNYQDQTHASKEPIALRSADSNEADGFRYKVFGVDKAGNPATVAETIKTGAEIPDSQIQNGLKEEELSKTSTNNASDYEPLYTIIYDDIAPVLTMQYTPAPRADRSSVYAFVYNKEGTKREEAYISGDSSVNVKLDEAYYDLSRLKYVQTKDGKNTLQTGKGPEWAKKSGAWDADTKTLTLDTANNDGVYTWIVYGEDRAGNAATVVEKFDDKQVANNLLVPMNGASAYASRTYKNKSEVFDPHYDVVIDKTAPEVSNMITMVGAKTNEDGDYDSEKMPSPKYYTDDKTFYYNTESGVRTAYTVLELNFDEKRMSETWTKEGAESKIPMSWTKETDKEQANQHTYILAFPDDATYENVRMAGTDKAGNHLVLKGGNQKDVRQEDWQASSSYDVSKNNDKPVQQSAALLVMKGETAVSDKVVNDKYGYVDTEVMLARRRILDRISPEAVITHVIPDNTTGYLYPHEEGDKDDNVKNTATMYSKNIVSTAVSVSDQYGNGDAAKAVLLDGDKLEVQRLFREAGGKFVSSNIKTVDWKKHPAKATPFRTNVSTDKEGRYAFTIKGTDRAGNPVHVSEKLKTDKANKAVYDRKKGGYEGEVKNEEATKTGGTYSSFFVLVYDATAPVYRFKINNPENLNETFDNTKGKQIAYYGASIPKIDAKYVVKDSNFDETRIHSAITSLSAKENGKRINNVDGLKPDWVSPANQCSKTSEKDGLVTAAFPLPVAVTAGNEGVYRFEIEGCDKAGNLLVRSNVQEKVDASSALKDLAARTVDKKRGTGRFWSERKVIDVTAPTGIFRVRKDKNGKDNYYQIGFKEGGNTADNYDPFRKETSAYVIVESDDQSPTRVSYDLRSLDKSKDSSYKSKNPLVSEGDHGYGNDNFRDVSVNGEQAFYIEHLVIKDRAGNIRANDKNSQYTLAQSNNVYLDVTPPVVSKINDAESPQVKIVASGSFTRHEADGERYIYKPDGSALDLKVSVTDPGGVERSSGLKSVTVEVTVGSEPVTKKVSLSNIPYTYSWVGGRGKDSHPNLVYEIPNGAIKIPTGSFAESNDITIKVEAEDNSGNKSVASKDGGLLKLGIDTTAPKVEVNYHDTVQPENEKFFKADRIVDIVVIDRNVDNSKINIQTNIGVPGSFSEPHGNKSTDGDGELGNEDRWMKTLSYNTDGDYTLQISGADALGNSISEIKWNGPAPNDFTVDKTAPKISIILPNTEKNVVNGTKYYDQSITGTIRIEEHNFQEDDKVKVELERANRGDDPEVGPLSKTKFGGLGTDVHESTIDYTKDGDYEITAAYTDKAGNIAVVEGGEGKKDDNTAWSGKFVVDLKDPVLEMDGATFRVNPATKKPLEGLVNQIYTEKDFAPLVHVNDTNYDAANSGFEVRTIGSGTNRASYQVKNQQDYKFDIQFDTFKVEKEMDGVYSVTAIATDLAKRTSTLEFKFSVNRFGSTYDYADGPTEDKVNRYYINDTKEPLRILEITPVDLKTHTMELFKDHERRTLKDGEEYTFATAAGRTIDETSVEGHRIYEYTVDPSVFDAEGVYDFIISSKDIAGNENSTSVYRDGTKSGNTIERVKFPIEFQVDKTVPVNRITGVESEKTRFQQDKLEITVFPEDYQTDISDVEVRIYTGNESGTNASEDEAKYQHYRYISEEEDAVKLAGEHVYPIEDAKKGIPVTLDGKNGLRSWQLLEVITTDLAGNKSTDYRVGDESVKLPETRRKFLVSTNPLIQYYYNRPLFFGSFGVAAALILLFLFLKSRKDKKEKGAA